MKKWFVGLMVLLTLEGDEEEETVSFTLDFTNSETPEQVIRLIPEV